MGQPRASLDPDSVTQKPLQGRCMRSRELAQKRNNRRRTKRNKDHQWVRKVAKWAPGDGSGVGTGGWEAGKPELAASAAKESGCGIRERRTGQQVQSSLVEKM